MKCRICGESNQKVFLDLGEQPLANALLTEEQLAVPEPRYPLKLAYCVACGFVQTTEIVPPEVLYKDYPYTTGTSREMTDHFYRLAHDAVDRLRLPKGSLVVDIGSNDGTLLKGFQAYHMNVCGVEPAENLAKLARASGVYTISEFFDADIADRIAMAMGKDKARVITATNVLTHVAKPELFLEAVESLLRPEGVFIAEMYYLPSILANGAFDQVYHEHLSYFTLRHVDALLRRAGLDGFHAEIVPVHGGSLRVYAARPGVHPPTREYMRLLDSEAQTLTLQDRCDHFAEKVQAVRKEFLWFLARCRPPSLVVGYGAAAKATVFLNYCHPDMKAFIPYVVDKSPLKQGRYIPGVRIPIKSPAVFETETPDYVVVFPWNLMAEIVADLRETLPNTRFRTPFMTEM